MESQLIYWLLLLVEVLNYYCHYLTRGLIDNLVDLCWQKNFYNKAGTSPNVTTMWVRNGRAFCSSDLAKAPCWRRELSAYRNTWDFTVKSEAFCPASTSVSPFVVKCAVNFDGERSWKARRTFCAEAIDLGELVSRFQ